MSWPIVGGLLALGALLLSDETPKRKLQRGDVVKSWRSIPENIVGYKDTVGYTNGIYDHYAVYVSDDEVIHYTSVDSDIDGDIKLTKTDFKSFLRGDSRFYIVVFPEKERLSSKTINREIFLGYQSSICMQPDLWRNDDYVPKWLLDRYKKYSPDEVVARARSALNSQNQDSYDLFSNNCEHFAVWCATGLHESEQIEALKRLNPFTLKNLIETVVSR